MTARNGIDLFAHILSLMIKVAIAIAIAAAAAAAGLVFWINFPQLPNKLMCTLRRC